MLLLVLGTLMTGNHMYSAGQTSTKLFRAQFCHNHYIKFANDMIKKGVWPRSLDPVESRDARCKYTRSGKNIGESPLTRKVAEVKKDIINDIWPIWKRLVPIGVPPSGVQWPEVFRKLKEQ